MRRGFTIIEMLLSLALLAIVAGFSYVMYVNAVQAGQMEAATRSVESLMRKAIALSIANDEDSRWGVRLEPSSAILFKGYSYLGHESQYDESVDLSGLAVSGDIEYVFERMTGEPISPGSVDFTNEYTGEVRRLTVHEKGSITIEPISD